MQKQFTQILQELGIDERSARVYLALLQLGEANIEQLAKHSLIPRTSLYPILETLEEQQLIARLPKRGRRLFVAEHPQKILKRFEEYVEILRIAIPQMELLAARRQDLPRIFLFEGKEGIKAIFRKILAEKRSFDAITSVQDMMTIARDYFEDFIQKRIQQNLRVRLITNRSPEGTRMKMEDGKMLRETRLIPPQYTFATANYIFGNNVAMISLKQEPILGLIIKDPFIAETHRMYFNLLWRMISTS